MLETADFARIESADLRGITFIDHIVTIGDRMNKLSHKFYGDTQYWWVIATFINTPTDGHLELGQTISIPLPLSDALALLDPDLSPRTY